DLENGRLPGRDPTRVRGEPILLAHRRESNPLAIRNRTHQTARMRLLDCERIEICGAAAHAPRVVIEERVADALERRELEHHRHRLTELDEILPVGRIREAGFLS